MSQACPNLCPGGTWGTLMGATSEPQACSNLCPAGTWGAAAWAASQAAVCPYACPAGTWGSAAGSTSQDQACPYSCPAGTWGSASGATSQAQACPNACPAGTWGSSAASTSQIQACTGVCPPGTWGAVVGATSQDRACANLCAAGSWGVASGATSSDQACPSVCPAGSWGAAAGATSQTLACPYLCEAGTWGSSAGSTSAAQACNNSCPAGSWGDIAGARSQAEACGSVCPPGRWGSKSGSTSQSQACPNMCPAGTWGTRSGASSLSQGCAGICPAGTYSDPSLTGMTSQQAACPYSCPAGTFGNAGFIGQITKAAACPYTCPAGTYGAPALAGQVTQGGACPNLCPSGTYGVVSGQISQSAACLACTNLPGNASYAYGCTWRCNVGFALSFDGTACLSTTTACAVGLYNNNGVCHPCLNLPPNSYFITDGGNYAYGCGWICITGFYQSGLTCSLCTTGQCPVGQYRSSCGTYSDAGCLSCTTNPANSAFITAGSPSTSNDCFWSCNSGYYLSQSSEGCIACTSSQCPVGHYRGPCGFSSDGECLLCTGNPANSLFTSPGSPSNQDNCAWSCIEGYYQDEQDPVCLTCKTDPCPIGQYRGVCTSRSDAICLPCTGGPVNSIFTSPGSPATSDNCSWSCNAGYYESGQACLGCTLSPCPIGHYRGKCGFSSDAECLQCTGNPINSVFTSPGSPATSNDCVWTCNAGYYQSGQSSMCLACTTSSCKVGEYRDECMSGSSSDAECLPCIDGPSESIYISINSSATSNYCFWTCNAGYYLSVETCLQCSSSACPIGQYREVCEIGSNVDAECLQCTGNPANSSFTSLASPSIQDNCAWSCIEGYFQRGQICLACKTDPCPIGQYRGVCTSRSDAICLPCTGGPVNSIFTSPGSPATSDNCSWSCNAGYYESGQACLGCTLSPCPIGHYRGKCGFSSDAECLPCTGNPKNSVFIQPGTFASNSNCSWTCNLTMGYSLSLDGKSCVLKSKVSPNTTIVSIEFVATIPITIQVFMEKENAYISSVALTAEVSASDVYISGIVQTRRSGSSRVLMEASVQVSTVVMGTNEAAALLQNQSKLNSNLQNAGIPACTTIFDNLGAKWCCRKIEWRNV